MGLSNYVIGLMIMTLLIVSLTSLIQVTPITSRAASPVLVRKSHEPPSMEP